MKKLLAAAMVMAMMLPALSALAHHRPGHAGGHPTPTTSPTPSPSPSEDPDPEDPGTPPHQGLLDALAECDIPIGQGLCISLRRGGIIPLP